MPILNFVDQVKFRPTRMSRMTLYIDGDMGHLSWEIPGLPHPIGVNLKFETRRGKKSLTKYNGLTELPSQAFQLLRRNGIHVPSYYE